MNTVTKHSDQTDVPAPASGDAGALPNTAPGAVPIGQRGQIYTMTAREGLDAAELVNAAFGRKTFGRGRPRRLEVAAPDGPSTAGGKRARQTIRLVPVSGEGAPVMCGYLDVARKLVELRGYAGVAAPYEARFGEKLDLAEDEYAALCGELETTLSVFRYTFTHDETPPAARRELQTTARISRYPNARLLNAILVGVTLVLAGASIMMIVR